MPLHENHCGPYIKQIHDTLEKMANNSLRDKDITMAQVQLLTVLYNSLDGRYPLKELENLLAVSQATVAGIVRRLEEKGFVSGYVSADDKRVKFAHITDSGKAICEAAQTEMERTEQQLTASLTPEERVIFALLLKKVSANLN
jgi:DNA-binding MarR family transcriptional regulator